MSVTTFEATVKNGQIVLPAGIHLPENARVYVVVPEPAEQEPAKIVSPRLVYPEKAADFQLQVKETDDAGLQQQ